MHHWGGQERGDRIKGFEGGESGEMVCCFHFFLHICGIRGTITRDKNRYYDTERRGYSYDRSGNIRIRQHRQRRGGSD